MWYFRGAPLELPPAGPDAALFFSSTASLAFMVPSSSIAALASSLYDRFWERIRRSCNWIVKPYEKELGLLCIGIHMVTLVLCQIIEFLNVIIDRTVSLVQIQELYKLATHCAR
jgi:hypothetical protein